MHCTWPMGPSESHEKKVSRKNPNMGLQAILSGPPRVSQSGVELENFFECDSMASDDAYGSYKTYGKVRLKFGPL